jgi:diguanylate cyclase (GGDEF)-like protein/PAS domain S-box-containing protein
MAGRAGGRMRKGLTFDAARKLHRRRGRSLIFAAIAWFVVGVTASVALSSIWGADRREAAETRFGDTVDLQRDRVANTMRSYRRMLTVMQGFFEVTDPTYDQFLRFSASLDLPSRPAVIGVEFIERRTTRPTEVASYPITMVAPSTAAPTLLHSDVATDPRVRAALEQVARDGDVTVTPPEANAYRQLRQQLFAPVHRDGRLVGWVGATVDPTRLAHEMIGMPDRGVSVTVRWATDPTVVGSVTGDAVVDGALYEFDRTEPTAFEDAPWTLDVYATSSFAPDAFGFPWAPFAAGIVATAIVSFVLLLLGRSRVAALDLATRLGMDLAASEARAKAVMDSAVEAIVTTDGVGHIESANPAAEALFGWSETELIGRPVGDIVPALALSEEGAGLGDVKWEEHEHMLEARRKDTTAVPVDVSLAFTAVGGTEMYTLIARDATVRKLHEDQLEHQATHDPLTGLANRKLFDELLVRAVFRAGRSRRALAVLYLDLDGFKDVNDVFGHQAGDRVLTETSRRLESVIRPGDIVARLGGDEFVVLCENLATPDDAEKIATRVVRVIGKPIAVAAGVATVTASVGIAIGGLGESAASVVARADEAMYRTKQDGKAGYRFAAAIIG